RHGTTTLFAALDILEGKVIGRCMQRHRHQEFIRFLNAVERQVPADKAVHVVLDNYATHKHPKSLPSRKRGCAAGSHAIPASPSTSRRPHALGPTRSKVGLPSSPGNGSSAASSPRSSSFRPPSTASSPMPTTSPSPSSGPNPPTPSSPLSNAGDKR